VSDEELRLAIVIAAFIVLVLIFIVRSLR